MKSYAYQGDFVKKFYAEGLVQGRANCVLIVLLARGVTVPDFLRERILAEKDLERLQRWLDRAVVAASIGEVLDEAKLMGIRQIGRPVVYDEATRRAMHGLIKGYEAQSDFAKKSFAEELAEGRAEVRANSVLIVLRARGITVPAPARERILAERDLERLQRWLERAVVAAPLSEVLDEPSGG
jgi:hypothetical protein